VGSARSDLKQLRPVVEKGTPLTLDFDNNQLLAELYGAQGQNLIRIEETLGVSIASRGNRVVVSGSKQACQRAGEVLTGLYARLQTGANIAAGDVDGAIRMAGRATGSGDGDGLPQIRTNKRYVKPRSPNQAGYIEDLLRSELVVGIGPAGTGKTYLAVAAAAAALERGEVERIILSRPAVEAGERLGFLPGDMREKVDPYLRPLYDALYDMLPGPQVNRSLETGEIEIAPLAFMRGRTLRNAFVILDEAQNATPMQMKMFLTRMGENSRMVITGDPSQIDLPFGSKSGLKDAMEILPAIKGVAITQFAEEDVVRHDLVTRIVKAYNRRDGKTLNLKSQPENQTNPEGSRSQE
jgi:phosphate starvation-inducible PhoH-like protein